MFAWYTIFLMHLCIVMQFCRYLIGSDLDKADMDGDTPYNIMFGKFSCLELINAQETSLVPRLSTF